MPIDLISSPDNPRLKEIVRLREAAYRKEKGFFIIEGLREARLAAEAGFVLRQVYICPEYLEKPDVDFSRFCQVIELGRKAYDKIAFGERKEGIIASAVYPKDTLADIKIKPKALVVVAEGLEKPGNLGAIARTADAAGVSALIAADTRVDIYNPNAIRSSLGALFCVKTVKESSAKVIDWLKENKIKIAAAVVDGNMDYTNVDFNQPLAIALGSEEKGLSRLWRDSDYRISIPMRGKVDSLNVSVSAGVILYEALRQRA